MDKSGYIKKLMAQQHKSARAVAREANIPYTTLLSMLSRGFGGASIDNVIKVCHALGISVDALVNESLGIKDETITPEEHKILSLYESMNADGRRRAMESLSDLASLPRYIASET